MKLISAVALLVILLHPEKAFSENSTNTLSERWSVAYGMGMANVSQLALRALYDGKTNDAIQILELNLDHSVCHMDGLMDKTSNPNHKKALKGILASVAEFRKLHPRPKITLTNSEEEQESLDEVARQAQSALERCETQFVQEAAISITAPTNTQWRDGGATGHVVTNNICR